MEHPRTVVAGDDNKSRIDKIILDHLGVEREALVPAALLVPEHDRNGVKLAESEKTDLGADSLDVVELVMAMEEEFRVEITDDEAGRLNTGTVQDLYDLIDAKTA